MATKSSELGDNPTNGGAATLLMGAPYIIDVEITGVSDMLFHRWNVEEIEAKAAAKQALEKGVKKPEDANRILSR